MNRRELAQATLRSALEVRRKAGVLFEDPVSVYDLTKNLRIEVWFVPGSSFGGIYAKEMQKVFVPSKRPASRRAFTCAHEVGH